MLRCWLLLGIVASVAIVGSASGNASSPTLSLSSVGEGSEASARGYEGLGIKSIEQYRAALRAEAKAQQKPASRAPKRFKLR